MNQKEKTKFRSSKKWKEFRHLKYVEQKGQCPICRMKLGKTANLHHLNLNAEEYSDLSKPENFVFLCHTCHAFVHYKYKAFTRRDFDFEQLSNIWTKMQEINGD